MSLLCGNCQSLADWRSTAVVGLHRRRFPAPWFAAAPTGSIASTRPTPGAMALASKSSAMASSIATVGSLCVGTAAASRRHFAALVKSILESMRPSVRLLQPESACKSLGNEAALLKFRDGIGAGVSTRADWDGWHGMAASKGRDTRSRPAAAPGLVKASLIGDSRACAGAMPEARLALGKRQASSRGRQFRYADELEGQANELGRQGEERT